jgi:acetylornithine deacetylase/succinyl-diaminopimelate desuccinylase-like protein
MTHLSPLPPTSTDTLLAMLRTCRPHGSQAEHDFITRFLLPLGVESDGFGNLWLHIEGVPVLWSSHVDTCHRQGGEQSILIDNGLVRLPSGSPSNCLGADCTAGVWLMTEMIAARVPGLYAFHRGEERGGLGSRYVARHEPEQLEGITAAIALDRRDTCSIITHQAGSRCCSDSFARSLAAAIGLQHRPDPTGVFTDTANYVDLVGECTNISVGYSDEHTPLETLNLDYLFRLRDALVSIDTRHLIRSRQPGETDPWLPHRYADPQDLLDIIAAHPHAVAEFLADAGVTAEEIEEFIYSGVPF